MKVRAELAHKAEQEHLENATEYEKMLYLLARYKKEISNIQSREQRAEMKKKILPEFLPWIEGALAGGTGKQDNVLMTWQVWAIDCDEYHLALQIADYAIHQDLVLPSNFSRTVPTMLAEEFADKAKKKHSANQRFEISYLEQVQRLTADCDIFDESRARLLRELGLEQVHTDPKQALATLERALQLDNNIGVRGEIKKLRKQLEKADNTE
ncbi:phage terminase small subunit [Pasteurella skyensis]|uniref:phage terminase small subunit n=1 Tax=Phocoenobacter skyensis TaxID=97481 RepID=UPI0027450D8A|nr:phage terminase small subunit [Pasteurella skyensis]MDP8176341.1 phage terminase small subunit [Pasteurella skyensis]MDP8199146.1 phage terminase small subunit [Pasteurella skyensis]